MNDKRDIFRKRFRELRHKLRLTQEAIGKILFLSRSCIANYERGFRYPDMQTLMFIAEKLGVDIGYFFA